MTSTMSLAAAICSMVSGRIMGGLDFSLVCFPKRCQNLSNATIRSMKKAFLALLMFTLGQHALYCRDVIHKGDVVVVRMCGELSPSLLMFVRRAEKLSESNGASAIIFEMNTYGGRL